MVLSTTDGTDIGWDAVVARYRSFEHLRGFRSTVAAMLRLVDLVRKEPLPEGIRRNVSHLNLTLTHAGADRHLAVCWSEPDGWGWAGEEGFVVSFVERETLATFDQIVVSEDQVVATIRNYLARLVQN